MNLAAAKKAAKQGKKVQADYFGPGWGMVFTSNNFYDENPITGSLLLHRFDQRDEDANWKSFNHVTG